MKRRYALAALTAVVPLALAGCLYHEPETPKNQIRGILDQIDKTVAALPGVTKEKAYYTNVIDDNADAAIDITLASKNTYDNVHDEAIRAFWTSPLKPVEQLNIQWTFTRENNTQGDNIKFDDDTTIKSLTTKYGPRPS